MSAIVSHTRCQKCQRILNVTELKDNLEGNSKICTDTVECKKNEQENIKNSNHAPE